MVTIQILRTFVVALNLLAKFPYLWIKWEFEFSFGWPLIMEMPLCEVDKQHAKSRLSNKYWGSFECFSFWFYYENVTEGTFLWSFYWGRTITIIVFSFIKQFREFPHGLFATGSLVFVGKYEWRFHSEDEKSTSQRMVNRKKNLWNIQIMNVSVFSMQKFQIVSWIGCASFSRKRLINNQ